MFLFSLGKYPIVELPDPMVVLLLLFWGSFVQFSTAAAPAYCSPQQCMRSNLIFPRFSLRSPLGSARAQSFSAHCVTVLISLPALVHASLCLNMDASLPVEQGLLDYRLPYPSHNRELIGFSFVLSEYFYFCFQCFEFLCLLGFAHQTNFLLKNKGLRPFSISGA